MLVFCLFDFARCCLNLFYYYYYYYRHKEEEFEYLGGNFRVTIAYTKIVEVPNRKVLMWFFLIERQPLALAASTPQILADPPQMLSNSIIHPAHPPQQNTPTTNLPQSPSTPISSNSIQPLPSTNHTQESTAQTYKQVLLLPLGPNVPLSASVPIASTRSSPITQSIDYMMDCSTLDSILYCSPIIRFDYLFVVYSKCYILPLSLPPPRLAIFVILNYWHKITLIAHRYLRHFRRNIKAILAWYDKQALRSILQKDERRER